MIEKKIRFSDLSGWLKTAVIGTWIIIVLYAIVFLTGFIIGILEEI